MKTLFTSLRSTLTNRAMYIRTRNEIAGLSMEAARDIGIHPSDAKAIARRAVWG